MCSDGPDISDDPVSIIALQPFWQNKKFKPPIIIFSILICQYDKLITGYQ